MAFMIYSYRILLDILVFQPRCFSVFCLSVCLFVCSFLLYFNLSLSVCEIVSLKVNPLATSLSTPSIRAGLGTDVGAALSSTGARKVWETAFADEFITPTLSVRAL